MIRRSYVKRSLQSKVAVWLASGALGVLSISMPTCLTVNGQPSTLCEGSSIEVTTGTLSPLIFCLD